MAEIAQRLAEAAHRADYAADDWVVGIGKKCNSHDFSLPQ
jgi:hypothetical protein